jgi:hypothetical protein
MLAVGQTDIHDFPRIRCTETVSSCTLSETFLRLCHHRIVTHLVMSSLESLYIISLTYDGDQIHNIGRLFDLQAAYLSTFAEAATFVLSRRVSSKKE